ncbi:GNAT family N-acetyltransferase [Companilactobacillus zhachilii]|uniref:GNAT family N-acetyltransferase n=1 Tax=Companilactobacillus zhachilii TaxID=2304606 RepID=A0A386PUK1_9LACO|nr:GNAT family N-acetyltransferase [Companilactobacillus zhachilii]MBL3530205.1 GNAT family N-acetyltransferase [Companilactobacillus zhachilii]
MSNLNQRRKILKIIPVTKRTPQLIKQLTVVWENAVRNTHSFLTETDIQYFKNSMPDILTQIPNLIIAVNEQQLPIGFMGIDGSEIAMLFIDQKYRGQGVGKRLIQFGIKNYQADRLTVNEQNPQAVGFYEHIGFVAYQRHETDDQGKPFPVLKMKLNIRN